MQPTIRRYTPADESALFELLEREGEEWQDYWKGANRDKYRIAQNNSISYLVFEGDTLCGYVRCKDDDGYGVYVHDLLVDKHSRGKDYGRMLMERVVKDYPEAPVYVMSDVDPYYSKLGYEIAGTLFIVKGSGE